MKLVETNKANLPVTEAPTMTSLEMVDYINVITERADTAKTVEELEQCIGLIEATRRNISRKYYPLCKAVYCHINSLAGQKITDNHKFDDEQGVYLIEFDDGSVKIGMTQTNFKKRLNTIRNQTSARILRSEFIECKNPSRVESSLHSKFSYARGNGEFFFINYESCLMEARLMIA
ncbi:GIY-YIG nuclease family protein [Xenorhabdus bovienii]|uniref:GIY-YIG nuclease family protein n=1 Tax=Xenorhabdus bovienii TaxID=40576 RepID=UPI0023B29F34|nr:GIY-YIG nuclease family protein [Xenorhabdus bovienii]MDE9456171.1 GIY-YIG nuclease family protein [Xenorhabdus bovienii]